MDNVLIKVVITMWSIWLITSIIFLIGEMFTTSFFLLWFSIGALIAMLISFFIESWIIQFSIFLAISFLLLCLTRPLTKKLLESKSKVESNVYSLIGKKALVIEPINKMQSTGKVKVNGEVWKAIIESTEITIPEGEEVVINAIDGVKLIVSKE